MKAVIKKMRRAAGTRFRLGLLLGLLAALHSGQAAVREGKVIIQTVQGTASFQAPNGNWEPGKVGQVLTAGTALKTEAGGGLNLFLGQNGPVLRLNAETALSFETISLDQVNGETVAQTKVKQESGTILGNIGKPSPASSFEIQTAKSTCEVAGSEFQMESSGNVHVISGSVQVRVTVGEGGEAKQKSVQVGAGQSLTLPADLTAAALDSLVPVPTPPEVTQQLVQQLAQAMAGVEVASTVGFWPNDTSSSGTDSETSIQNPKVEVISQ